MPSTDDDSAAIEALRRSLYRPGTDADAAARYREALALAPAPPEQGHMTAAPRTDRARRARRGRIALIAVGAGAVLLVGAVSATLAATPSVRSAAPTASPTLTVPIGAHAESLGLDEQTRTAITTALTSGSRAGLAFLFDFHPEQRPAALRTARRYGIVEVDGTGPGTTRIPSGSGSSAAHGGRVTVLLVTDRDERASWSVIGVLRTPSAPVQPVPILRLRGEHRAGEPVAASARYPAGGAPALLTVDVPTGARWGAAFVFTR